MSPTWAREVGFVPTALPRDQLSQGWGIPRPDSEGVQGPWGQALPSPLQLFFHP